MKSLLSKFLFLSGLVMGLSTIETVLPTEALAVSTSVDCPALRTEIADLGREITENCVSGDLEVEIYPDVDGEFACENALNDYDDLVEKLRTSCKQPRFLRGSLSSAIQ